MSYRDPKKNYDLFSALSKSREQSEREIGIMKLKTVIDWELFRPLMEDVCGYSQKDAKKGGRPAFDTRCAKSLGKLRGAFPNISQRL